MRHNHVQDKAKQASLKNLLFAIAINGGIVAFELVFGLLIFIQVRSALLSIPGVAEINDLHVWRTGTNRKLLSAHLRMTKRTSDNETIIRQAQEMLLNKYGINNTTLQILPFSAGDMEHCNHCN